MCKWVEQASRKASGYVGGSAIKPIKFLSRKTKPTVANALQLVRRDMRDIWGIP